MYDNPIVQEHMKSLEASPRFSLLEPDTGHLACNIVGKGRMPDPHVIVSALAGLFGPRNLEGKKFVITAGPTREPIDPARFLSNPSSGKMGFALATEALKRGATVTLIHGPVTLPAPNGAHCVVVERAEEMKQAVVNALQDAHILVMAAAVADWSPVETASAKEEKQGDTKNILFERTPDILAETRGIGNALRVGFAAQTHDLELQAKRKLEEKGLDLIVGNPIGGPEAGFAADTNEGIVLTREGALHRIPRMSKSDFACQIMNQIENTLQGGAS
jgi:phosphopantothenoylcysteine decarboxylase/phosphopantothenate--cysteine ligase